MSMHNESSRKTLCRVATATAALLFSAGVALAQAPQSAPAPQGGGMDRGATGHEGMGHEGMGHEGMGHEGMGHEGMGHEGMGHEGMGHEGMGHEGMGHEGMGHEGMGHEGMAGMGGMDHGGGGMDGMMGGMDHGGGMMRHMLCGVTEHVEGRLAYLKAELKLTDAQQAAWNTFADAYRATTQKTAKVCAAMDAAGADHAMHKGVLGHLTMMEHHMSDHLDSLRGLKGALEPLFAALTEEQKKTADHALTNVMDVGMGKMMGH
jgi:pentapeptide MXKDX repeat protein